MFGEDQAQIKQYQEDKIKKDAYVAENIHEDYRQGFYDYIAYQKGK